MKNLISINDLVTMVETIAGITVRRTHDLTAPQGVRGRNSDNTLLSQWIGWTPQISLEDGMERTYRSIWDQMARSTRLAA